MKTSCLTASRVLVSLVLAAALSGPAGAGLRTIPATAAVTAMSVNGDGTVVLGKKTYSLSVGAQIRDAENRIVLPSMLSGPYKVRVLLNVDGQLERAWILTDEEAAQPAPKF